MVRGPLSGEGSHQSSLREDQREREETILHMVDREPKFESELDDASDEEDAADEVFEEDVVLDEPGLRLQSIKEESATPCPVIKPSIVPCPACGMRFEFETVEEQAVHINRCLDNDIGAQSDAGHACAQPAQQSNDTLTSTSRGPGGDPAGAQKSILDFLPTSARGYNTSTERAGKKSKARRGAGKAASSAARGRWQKRLKRGRVLVEEVGKMPPWMSVPGTSFTVDAFKYPLPSCSHWFLTHFHPENYQGLTRSFPHGTIYCSPLTGRLLSLKVGVPAGTLRPIPLGERTRIDDVDVTLIDANHCPGSVMILFELPDGQTILHTGHFRICPEMSANPLLTTLHFNTVILDITDGSPEFNLPKQESIINFVIDAIRAEAFNPKTLFLIGTDPVGKEKIFLAVVRELKRKVYVGVAKRRLLASLAIPDDDMALLTADDRDSHIHAVPLWSITSFRRMEQIARHYRGRYNTVIAFAPRGESFGRGKKRTPRRKYHQVSFIRYDLPYSEHCTFSELQEFVKLVEPDNIVPSGGKSGQEESMDALLKSLAMEGAVCSGDL